MVFKKKKENDPTEKESIYIFYIYIFFIYIYQMKKM